MKFPHADLKFARDTVIAFSRHLAAARAIEAAGPQDTNFWITLKVAAYDGAVTKWCILFGSHNERNQPLHWKHMFEDEDGFRAGLLAACGVDRAAWDAYAAELRAYRDQLLAHHDLDPDPARHPPLDIAQRAAEFYFEQLRPKLAAVGARDADQSLADEFANATVQYGEFAAAAVAATRGIQAA